MSVAKKIRLGRILQRGSRRSIIVPIDHGLTLGPIAGIESVQRMARWLVDPNIDALIAHKGIISRLAERNLLQGRGVILHVNGMTSLAESPDDKEVLTSVQTALTLGVDALSLQINFDGRNDNTNWRMLGRTVDEATRHGFPVLTMLYDKAAPENSAARVRRLRHLMRTAIELGTDAIKIGPSADPAQREELASVLADLHEDVLVFVAGGELTDDRKILAEVAFAMDCGASGVSIGRNIFSRKDPHEFLERLASVVHDGAVRPITRGEMLHVN